MAGRNGAAAKGGQQHVSDPDIIRGEQRTRTDWEPCNIVVDADTGIPIEYARIEKGDLDNTYAATFLHKGTLAARINQKRGDRGELVYSLRFGQALIREDENNPEEETIEFKDFFPIFTSGFQASQWVNEDDPDGNVIAGFDYSKGFNLIPKGTDLEDVYSMIRAAMRQLVKPVGDELFKTRLERDQKFAVRDGKKAPRDAIVRKKVQPGAGHKQPSLSEQLVKTGHVSAAPVFDEDLIGGSAE